MKVALFQARSGIDPSRNAERLLSVCEDAAQSGAAMLFTPEMSGLLDRNGARADVGITVPDDDIVLAAMRGAARRHGIWVQLGSLAVRRPDGRLANRSFVIDDHGTVKAQYDKLHLFDVDLPTGESWRESSRYAAGDEAVVIRTPLGTLGLSVCYDLRFPALYASLVTAGATILSVPAAFTVPTGTAHWHVLLRTRAIESGAFVIAAAQGGTHEDERRTFGHSLVIDPWGRVLLDMTVEEDVLGYAEIDPTRVAEARAAIPALAHRREIGEARLVS